MPDIPVTAGLTEKQEKLVKILLSAPEDKSDKDIMIEAGYSPNQPSTRILQSDKIVNTLRLALENEGITTKLLAEVLYDGLTAREDHNDITSKPERIVRLKYYEKIAKILGLESIETNGTQSWEQTITSITINNDISHDDRQ